jgi:tetratricopeptide (TPR) repeat protein
LAVNQAVSAVPQIGGEAVNAVKPNSWASLVSGRLWQVVCGFFALALIVTPLERAAAQEASGRDKASLEAQKETLFQQMFRDPANLDVTFAYADVSARLGDYEAAVSALERMLLFNPDLPRVQLELGALYYRMGSYELARDYFDKAAAANPPSEVSARIEQYLADIEKSRSRHHLSGYVFFGG